MGKYLSSQDEGELLPNLLKLTDKESIEQSEFEGFLLSELTLSEKLTRRTKFNIKYINGIHKLALSHLYSFAGKIQDSQHVKRRVSISCSRVYPKKHENI